MHGVRHFSFSEGFTYILNGWSLIISPTLFQYIFFQFSCCLLLNVNQGYQSVYILPSLSIPTDRYGMARKQVSIQNSVNHFNWSFFRKELTAKSRYLFSQIFSHQTFDWVANTLLSKSSCLMPLRKKGPYLDFSGPYFPAFRLNTERHGVSLRIQSKCGRIWTRKTQNTDTFDTRLQLTI